MSRKSNWVHWFEIPATDLDRAKSFYEKVCNVELTLKKMGAHRLAWFPMEQGASGATGTLIQGEGYQPSHLGTLVYLSVTDVESTLVKVVKHGGRTLLPKTTIGQYGAIAHFEDTEGNRVALHEDPG